MQTKLYEAPQMEIIEVEVEKGFAGSGGGNEGIEQGPIIPLVFLIYEKEEL